MIRKLMAVVSVGAICLMGLTSTSAQKVYSTLEEYERVTGKKIEKFHEAPMLRERVTSYSVTVGKIVFYVELAITPEEQNKGLSGRTSIPHGTGMLFIFPYEEIQTFWMMDCYVPLDVAFISADQRVVSMKTMSVWPDPKDPNQKLYSSDKPCKYALEVLADELERAGLKTGDAVSFSPNIPISEHTSREDLRESC